MPLNPTHIKQIDKKTAHELLMRLVSNSRTSGTHQIRGNKIYFATGNEFDATGLADAVERGGYDDGRVIRREAAQPQSHQSVWTWSEHYNDFCYVNPTTGGYRYLGSELLGNATEEWQWHHDVKLYYQLDRSVNRVVWNKI